MKILKILPFLVSTCDLEAISIKLRLTTRKLETTIHITKKFIIIATIEIDWINLIKMIIGGIWLKSLWIIIITITIYSLLRTYEIDLHNYVVWITNSMNEKRTPAKLLPICSKNIMIGAQGELIIKQKLDEQKTKKYTDRRTWTRWSVT